MNLWTLFCYILFYSGQFYSVLWYSILDRVKVMEPTEVDEMMGAVSDSLPSLCLRQCCYRVQSAIIGRCHGRHISHRDAKPLCWDKSVSHATLDWGKQLTVQHVAAMEMSDSNRQRNLLCFKYWCCAIQYSHSTVTFIKFPHFWPELVTFLEDAKVEESWLIFDRFAFVTEDACLAPLALSNQVSIWLISKHIKTRTSGAL